MLKTLEELADDGELCKYCRDTEYGEHSSYSTPNGYSFCEGTFCETAYESYLDTMETTDNIVKYMMNVKMIKEE